MYLNEIFDSVAGNRRSYDYKEDKKHILLVQSHVAALAKKVSKEINSITDQNNDITAFWNHESIADNPDYREISHSLRGGGVKIGSMTDKFLKTDPKIKSYIKHLESLDRRYSQILQSINISDPQDEFERELMIDKADSQIARRGNIVRHSNSRKRRR